MYPSKSTPYFHGVGGSHDTEAKEERASGLCPLSSTRAFVSTHTASCIRAVSVFKKENKIFLIKNQ